MDFDFAAKFDFSRDVNFAAKFNFGREFAPTEDNNSYNSLFDSDSEFDEHYVDESMSRQKHHQCRPHQKHPKNRFYWNALVKTSCWYVKFLHPDVQELMSKVSMSDQNGEFCHCFRMPLEKVERLVDLFIQRGYIPEPKRTMHKLNTVRGQSYW